MIRLLLVILVMTSLAQTFAAVSPKIKIGGKVKSFNEKFVILDQDGKKIKLPRNIFPKKITPNEEVTLEIDQSITNR